MRSFLAATAAHDTYDLIRQSLATDGNRIERAADLAAAREKLRHHRYDIVILDLELPELARLKRPVKETLQIFWDIYPAMEIVVISSRERVRQAFKAVKAGASDYLSHPLDPEEVKFVIETIQNTVLLQSELDYLRGQFWKTDSLCLVQTKCAAMKAVYEKVRSAAPTDTIVLLTGETGTGKGVLARLIHRHSRWENAQFISVHCGAIPETLLEAELFGHEKGAFTGAVKRKLGRFEIARNGTIFLDEVGTITSSAQAKLLQVLQDHTFSRLGGEEMLESDGRVIAATNADLREMSREGSFRKDLYYRLNVFPIEIPPLRKRREDIPLFVDVFLKRLNRDIQKDIREVHPHVLEAMRQYDWPGNIRELENLVERAYILETSCTLTPESFPSELFASGPASWIAVDASAPLAEARRAAVEAFEEQYLMDLLTRNRGRIDHSATEAGISTRQLHKLLLKYNIHKEAFKT
jgi:DNA-binding NtrC family response regulator